MGDGEAEQNLCFAQRYDLCSLRVLCGTCCPWSWVRLISRTGCREHTHSLLCAQEINLGFLSPGDYLLTLGSPQGRQDLWVHLSPGSNLECRFHPHTTQWCWRRLPGHCSYNLTET